MPKRGDIESARDILEAIKRIEAYTKGWTFQRFLKNTEKQDAVVRNLEIIGEAAKILSADFKRKNPEADWKAIAGMRDRLIHQYFGINWEVVWKVAKERLPDLKKAAETALGEIR